MKLKIMGFTFSAASGKLTLGKKNNTHQLEILIINLRQPIYGYRLDRGVTLDSREQLVERPQISSKDVGGERRAISSTMYFIFGILPGRNLPYYYDE